MAKRLSAVPDPKRAPRAPRGPADDAPGHDQAPDLSRIAEGLRPLAVPLSELAFMVGNAVTHPPEQVEQLRASLRTFGQVEPLIVNRRESPAVVIGGNGRMQAMLAEGWSHTAAVFVDLDRAKANALSLVLNQSPAGREWDKEALDALLRDVDTGNDEVLDRMLAELSTEVGIVPPDPGDLLPPGPREPKQVACPECGHEFDPKAKSDD